MKILTCIFVVAASLSAQDAAKTTTPPAAKDTKKTTKPVAVTAIPKDAVETTPGFYRWTDKDGKAWTYRRTPFGVTRWPEQQGMYDKQNSQDQETTAVEEGDSIRFERLTPFGKRTWVRKKTEMNETEKAIWANQQQKTGAAGHVAEKE